MRRRVDFGVGDVFLFKIDQNTGERYYIENSFINSNSIDFENNIITLVDNITDSNFSTNRDVVINILDSNKYCYGKIVDVNKIKIDLESNISLFYEDSLSLKIYLGTSAGIFKGVTLSKKGNSVDYRGQYIVAREKYYNDVDININIDEIILNLNAVDFLNGYNNLRNDNIVTTGFFDNIHKKNRFKPKDISILVLKKQTTDKDKEEELYCYRVSSGELITPFSRNKFSQKNLSFSLMKKSIGDKSIVDYIYDGEFIDLSYLYLYWEDDELFLWEDGQEFTTDNMEI